MDDGAGAMGVRNGCDAGQICVQVIQLPMPYCAKMHIFNFFAGSAGLSAPVIDDATIGEVGGCGILQQRRAHGSSVYCPEEVDGRNCFGAIHVPESHDPVEPCRRFSSPADMPRLALSTWACSVGGKIQLYTANTFCSGQAIELAQHVAPENTVHTILPEFSKITWDSFRACGCGEDGSL